MAEDKGKAKPAEDAKKDAEAAVEKKPKSKGPIMLLGGVLGLIVLGGLGAFFALPKKAPEKPHFQGPFRAVLLDTKIAVNLRDNAGRRYLQINGECLYYGYNEEYLATRQTDPFYKSLIINAINRVASEKYLEGIHSGTGREQFIEEIRDTVEPLIFPYHIGATQLPLQRDEVSGLKPGVSSQRATFRGRYHDHLLKVDAVAKSIQLDDGPPATFAGGEDDLKVFSKDGEYVYVDVAEIVAEFVGEVPIGVHGAIREFIETDYVFQ